MRIKFLIVFSLVVTFITAQTSTKNLNQFESVTTLITGNGTWITNTTTAKVVHGSPYLYDNWNNKSKIYFDDKVYKIDTFNYNIRLERFEAKLSKDSVLAINPRGVKKIEIADKSFVRCLDPEFQRNSYFEVLASVNGYVLLRKHNVLLKEGSINPMTLQQMQADRLIKSEGFYISKSKDRNDLEKIKLKRSTINAMLDKSHLVKVKDFVKQNKLKYKNVDDLFKVFDYCKTL